MAVKKAVLRRNGQASVPDTRDDNVDLREEEQATEPAVDDTAPGDKAPWLQSPNCPKDCIVLGPDEPITVKGTVEGVRNVRLSERVVRAVIIPKTRGWHFVLLMAKNAVVPMTLVSAVNNVPVQRGVLMPDPKTIEEITLPAEPVATDGEIFTLPKPSLTA